MSLMCPNDYFSFMIHHLIGTLFANNYFQILISRFIVQLVTYIVYFHYFLMKLILAFLHPYFRTWHIKLPTINNSSFIMSLGMVISIFIILECIDYMYSVHFQNLECNYHQILHLITNIIYYNSGVTFCLEGIFNRFSNF